MQNAKLILHTKWNFQDDKEFLSILNCVVPISRISGTVINVGEKTGYVSTSPVSSMTISAINAANGQAVATPTITVKKKSATGTVVNATSGTTYPVVAGDTYYVKVEKSGFTTVAFTYKAQPGALPLVVAMTAA